MFPRDKNEQGPEWLLEEHHNQYLVSVMHRNQSNIISKGRSLSWNLLSIKNQWSVVSNAALKENEDSHIVRINQNFQVILLQQFQSIFGLIAELECDSLKEGIMIRRDMLNFWAHNITMTDLYGCCMLLLAEDQHHSQVVEMLNWFNTLKAKCSCYVLFRIVPLLRCAMSL